MDESKGVKYDKSKPMMDLLPAEALIEFAKVMTFGHGKYGRANWANGIEMSRLLAAAQRHLLAFSSVSGEDIDPESQTLHLANAGVNIMFAIWMYKNRPDLDDRWCLPLREKLKTNKENC